ncbi:MAG TPA: carboxylating nicotinate-nucleotide diphosphorylase [Bacteroidetes bacterium]|nr:carboxylating nicotinate-nucleotide diphosphorylase [Bacteroidota bacterium]
MNDSWLLSFIERALEEDIGTGDHSSLASVPARSTGHAVLLAKEEGIIAGADVARQVFLFVDPDMAIRLLKTDGEKVFPGDRVFEVEGSAHAILKCERLVLNIMQRMSGIASQTRLYTEQLAGTQARLLDTRKTAPGMRYLEKLAVRIGGGENHRMGLYDMILLKDNHIDFAGGVKKALEKTRIYLQMNQLDLKVEVEARNLEEVKLILETGGADRIMLDNFTPKDLRQAVKLIGGRTETEASGNITLQNIREYAETGVDFISVGALTHHIKCLDMSLKASKQ